MVQFENSTKMSSSFLPFSSVGIAELYYLEEALVVEFMYLAFTRGPGESYRGRLRSVLCLCDVLRVRIVS